MDSQISLQQPILDGGIRSINFFNGRLLSARDLTREQTANRDADRHLGQAIGEGIAYGLEVTKSNASTQEFPVVTVQSGLAVNGLGQTLMLVAKSDVTLVRRGSSGTGAVQPFGECAPLQTGTYIAGAGVYLLTLAPAEGTEGLASTHSLQNSIASCNTDTTVRAVQFRLIQIDQQLPPGTLLSQNQNLLRNVIAYECFGAKDPDPFAANPFGPPLTQYGLVDSLRPNWLTRCEVPLAILYWTLVDGIKFIDIWAVRRRLARKSSTEHWGSTLDERRAAEAEARLQQFLDHALDLAARDDSESISARDHFEFLPPAGAIPLSSSSVKAFDYQKFFKGITVREPNTPGQPIYLEGARIEKLLRDSFSYAPVKTDSGQMFWLYWVRENAQQILNQPATMTCLLFSSGQMPYAAAPRFDVAHWNFSNFV